MVVEIYAAYFVAAIVIIIHLCKHRKYCFCLIVYWLIIMFLFNLQRPEYYVFNILFAALLPVICRYYAVEAGHSRAYFSTISGNYLLAPERWFFAIGVSIFVCVYLSTYGFLSLRFANLESGLSRYLLVLESAILLIFLLISWFPAHLVLGLHALLGSLLFTSAIMWMSSLCFIDANDPIFLQALRFMILVLAAMSLLGMMAFFPAQLIAELVGSRGDTQRTLYLLALDSRWTNFAVFEWIFYYMVLAFLLSYTPSWLVDY